MEWEAQGAHPAQRAQETPATSDRHLGAHGHEAHVGLDDVFVLDVAVTEAYSTDEDEVVHPYMKFATRGLRGTHQ